MPSLSLRMVVLRVRSIMATVVLSSLMMTSVVSLELLRRRRLSAEDSKNSGDSENRQLQLTLHRPGSAIP